MDGCFSLSPFLVEVQFAQRQTGSIIIGNQRKELYDNQVPPSLPESTCCPVLSDPPAPDGKDERPPARGLELVSTMRPRFSGGRGAPIMVRPRSSLPATDPMGATSAERNSPRAKSKFLVAGAGWLGYQTNPWWKIIPTVRSISTSC